MDDARGDGTERVVVSKLDLLRMSATRFPPLTETDTVSFSLTIGTTRIASSSLNVFCALRYRVRWGEQDQ